MSRRFVKPPKSYEEILVRLDALCEIILTKDNSHETYDEQFYMVKDIAGDQFFYLQTAIQMLNIHEELWQKRIAKETKRKEKWRESMKKRKGVQG